MATASVTTVNSGDAHAIATAHGGNAVFDPTLTAGNGGAATANASAVNSNGDAHAVANAYGGSRFNGGAAAGDPPPAPATAKGHTPPPPPPPSPRHRPGHPTAETTPAPLRPAQAPPTRPARRPPARATP